MLFSSLELAQSALQQRIQRPQSESLFVLYTDSLEHALRHNSEALILVLNDGQFCCLTRQNSQRSFIPLAPLNDSSKAGGNTPLSHTALASAYAGKYYVLKTTFPPHKLPTSKNEFNYVSLTRRLWPKWVEIGIGGLVINFVGLLLPIFSSVVYDKVIGNHVNDTLWALTIGMLIFALLEILLRVIRIIAFEKIAADSEIEFEKSFWQDLMKMDLSKIPPVGALLSNFRSVIQSREFFSAQTMQAVTDLPFLALYLLVLFWIGGALVFVSIGFAVLLLLGYLVLHKPQFDYGRVLVRASGEKISLLAEMIAGQEWLKRSALKYIFAFAWSRQSDEYSSTQAKARFWTGMANTWSGFCITLSSVAILVVGVYLTEDLTLTMGSLIAASIINSRWMASIAGATGLFTRFSELKKTYTDLAALLKTSHTTENETLPLRQLTGKILVHQLHWRFTPSTPPLLKGIHLHIKAGEKIGLVGRSGAGKSTLLRCLMGLIEPNEGEVQLDDCRINQHHPMTLENSIGYKPQELFLFRGSLEDNLLGNSRNVPQMQIEQALNISGLSDCFTRGELSLDKYIENGGSNLSGGQRQMICLARVLIQRPVVLILDEPTNGLDEVSEQQFLSQLMAAYADATVIISTHSANVLQFMERIIALDGGKIVADGPREKILVANQ